MPSTVPETTCKLLKQFSAEACVQGQNFGCNATSKTMWARGCRGRFQCGRATVSCGDGAPPHPPSCDLSCDAGAFAGHFTRLSTLNPLDDGFRPAKPGIENPVVVRSQDNKWWIAVYHIYTGATIGVSYSKDGLHWTRQEGDLRLGTAYCGDVVTTACGLVPEPSKGKGVYSLLYTASGKCSSGTCESESVCQAYLINAPERNM
eukprot:COSAG01_NODE_3971_length_5480_cov_21.700242_2_plen_204_part_00